TARKKSASPERAGCRLHWRPPRNLARRAASDEYVARPGRIPQAVFDESAYLLDENGGLRRPGRLAARIAAACSANAPAGKGCATTTPARAAVAPDRRFRPQARAPQACTGRARPGPGRYPAPGSRPGRARPATPGP